MSRISISEKHLLFLPALLLSSQIFYRVLYLQTTGAGEAMAFSILPAALAAIALGVFLHRPEIPQQNRFLLHTVLITLLTFCTTIPHGLIKGAELIVTCILAGFLYGGLCEKKGSHVYILAGIFAAGLLFTPTSILTQFLVFLLLPVAQVCLLGAYFALYMPRKNKFIFVLPLFLSFFVIAATAWHLYNHPGRAIGHHFQAKHQMPASSPGLQHGDIIPVIAILSQPDELPPDGLKLAVIEEGPFKIRNLLETLKSTKTFSIIDSFHVSYTQNSQRLFPVVRPPDIVPAELPDYAANYDIVFVAPPLPLERSGAYLSTAAFYAEILSSMPEKGILAVFASGSPEQKKRLFHSMPAETVWIDGPSCTWFIARKDGKKPIVDCAALAQRLPGGLSIYREIVELVLPTFQTFETPVRDPALANRPFHSPLRQLTQEPAKQKITNFLLTWYGVLLAAVLGIYLLLRYFISWKPIHKPCFQAFEAGLLVMLLFSGAILGGSGFGCGPIFSLLPHTAMIFCGTLLYFNLLTEQRKETWECGPLVVLVFLLLLGWNLVTSLALIAAILLHAAQKRPVPDLIKSQKIFPQLWLFTGMAAALVLTLFFLDLFV